MSVQFDRWTSRQDSTRPERAGPAQALLKGEPSRSRCSRKGAIEASHGHAVSTHGPPSGR
jgi:hypothetical protein